MKTKYFIIGALLALVVSVPFYSLAQQAPNFWKVVNNNSLRPLNTAWTITDGNGNAYSTSTSGGGGVSTSTANTWSKQQTFTSELVSGSSTAQSYTSTSTVSSNIQVSNSEFFVPPNFATIGCAASSTATDLSSCINAWLVTQVNVVSSTRIHINFAVPQANWQNTLNIYQAGLFVSINCPVGTPLKYGGSGYGIYWDDGNPAAHVNQEMSGCLLMGQNTLIAAAQTNVATTTGINCGGVNGCVNVNFHDMTINGFGRQFAIASGTATSTNAYMLSLNNVSLSGGNCGGGAANMTGCLLFMGIAQNSGERFVADKVNFTDPGNSTSGNAIYLSDGAAASILFSNCSLDNVQVYVGFSNGQVTFDKCHVEDAAQATYGTYIPFYATSSAATTLSLTNIEFAHDASSTGSAWTTLVKHGVNLRAWNIHIDNYGGQTITNFADHTLNNGSETELICGVAVQSGALTNISNNQAYSAAIGAGCIQGTANSYPITWYQQSTNIAAFRNGNANVATNDSVGNWTLGIAGTSGSLAVQGNVTATGTLTTTGNIKTFNSIVNPPTVSAVSSTLTGASASSQVFTGASIATSSLPTISAMLGQIIMYKNRGSAALSITSTSTDFIWLSATNASATSYSLTPGSSTAFQNDGTYWNQLWK